METRKRTSFAFSVFVFDPQTGELRRNGKPQRMPPQVARLLAVLIENPGTMVSRETIRNFLWPDGEVLDYDHSINRAVSQLRAVLYDRSSKSASYIDTISKRGYRFSGEVREITSTTPEPSKPVPEPQAAPAVNPVAIVEYSQPTESAAAEVAPEPWVPPVAQTKTLFWRRPRTYAFSAAILLVLAAAAGFALYRARQSAAIHVLSLGIVPFEASGEGAASLAESFRLDLADSLSQVPTIEIRAAHSFDNLGLDESRIQTRAQELGIEAILFGKFTVVGDQCQLRFELVRSNDGVHLTSLQYSGTRDQLASIRDRIEQDIFQRLNRSQQAEGVNLARPSSPAAYASYLRGRALLANWTDENLLQAIQAFQDAIQKDPNYARAYAGLASANFVLAQHGASDRNSSMEKSREAATKALALDPSLAEAHAMLGQIALLRDWNFPAASEQLRRATELDPYHAVYHQWSSILYCTQGKYDLALEEIDKAHAADPDWGPPYMTEVYIADTAHRYDRADKAAAVLFRKMPNWSLAHDQNGMNLWASGRYAAAIDEWHLTAVMDKNADRAHLEEQGLEAFRKGGVPAYARVRLNAIATRKGISYEEFDFVPAEWHAYAGDWDQVFEDLDKLLKTRSSEALQVGTNPAYEPLHKNPRFLALLKHAGLPLPEEAASPTSAQ